MDDQYNNTVSETLIDNSTPATNCIDENQNCADYDFESDVCNGSERDSIRKAQTFKEGVFERKKEEFTSADSLRGDQWWSLKIRTMEGDYTLYKYEDSSPSSGLVDLTNFTQKERREMVKSLNSLPVTYQIGETKNEMVITSDILIAEFLNQIFGESVLAIGDICPIAAFIPMMVTKLYVILPSSVSEKTWFDFDSLGIALSEDDIVVQIVKLDDGEFSLSEFISNPDYLPDFFKRVKAGEQGRSIKREGPYDDDIDIPV